MDESISMMGISLPRSRVIRVTSFFCIRSFSFTTFGQNYPFVVSANNSRHLAGVGLMRVNRYKLETDSNHEYESPIPNSYPNNDCHHYRVDGGEGRDCGRGREKNPTPAATSAQVRVRAPAGSDRSSDRTAGARRSAHMERPGMERSG